MAGPLKTGRLPARKCAYCGEQFLPKRIDTRFCSKDCMANYRNSARRSFAEQKLSVRECVVCGAEFMPARSNHICCSLKCNDKKQKQRKSEELRAKLLTDKRTCKNQACQKEFAPRRSNQLFCSESCCDRQGKRDWKKRNSDRVRTSEANRKRFKYKSDSVYRESRKEKSLQRFHALTSKEKTERSRRSRALRDPESLRAYHREYFRIRSEEDVNFRLINLLRARTSLAIKSGKGKKLHKTEELLGCGVSEARDYLESLFDEQMNWGNWGVGGWHLDHIRPCISFDMTDKNQQFVCFNWRNLAPLWGGENLIKNCRYDYQDEIAWVDWMRELGYEGPLYLRF